MLYITSMDPYETYDTVRGTARKVSSRRRHWRSSDWIAPCKNAMVTFTAALNDIKSASQETYPMTSSPHKCPGFFCKERRKHCKKNTWAFANVLDLHLQKVLTLPEQELCALGQAIGQMPRTDGVSQPPTFQQRPTPPLHKLDSRNVGQVAWASNPTKQKCMKLNVSYICCIWYRSVLLACEECLQTVWPPQGTLKGWRLTLDIEASSYWVYKPYYGVDDHLPLYGNNGSLDPSTYRNLELFSDSDHHFLAGLRPVKVDICCLHRCTELRSCITNNHLWPSPPLVAFVPRLHVGAQKFESSESYFILLQSSRNWHQSSSEKHPKARKPISSQSSTWYYYLTSLEASFQGRKKNNGSYENIDLESTWTNMSQYESI